jgi:hypothetical protein
MATRPMKIPLAEEDEIIRAVRQDTLKAVQKLNEHVRMLSGKTDRVSERMRESDEKYVRKLEKELVHWEQEYQKIYLADVFQS